MSITYCHNCNKNLDEDIDVEHFEVCGIEEDNSMIKPNPFWDEVKVKKGTKIPHTDLEIDKAYVPNDKYFELITKLVGQINE